MTRDYKKRAGNSHKKKSSSNWGGFIGGLAIGLSIAVLVYLSPQRANLGNPTAATTASNKTEQAAPPTSTALAQEDNVPAKRRFDFYTLLPELEVVIPEDERTPTNNRKPPATATPEATGAEGGYLLQAGSFQQHSEADSLKANLALLGVAADIQTVNVDKDTWHRVRIGPYNNLVELNKVRDKLRKNQIDTLLMKARQ